MPEVSVTVETTLKSKAPSPQPSPGGRGSRPRCQTSNIDLKDRFDLDSQPIYPVGVLRQHPPISPLSLWERVRVRVFRGPTEVSDVKHRPERPSRLWIHSGSIRSAYFVSIPPISPLSLWERVRVRVFRGPTEVSDVKHRPERPSRLWIHSRSIRSAYFASIPQSVPSASGRGLG